MIEYLIKNKKIEVKALLAGFCWLVGVCFNPCLALLTEISDLYLHSSVIKKIKTVNSEEISTSLFRLGS